MCSMDTREQTLALHHYAFEQVTEEYKLAMANNASTFVLLEIQVSLNTIREQYMNCLLQTERKAA